MCIKVKYVKDIDDDDINTCSEMYLCLLIALFSWFLDVSLSFVCDLMIIINIE
jgi:hypothetical protein